MGAGQMAAGAAAATGPLSPGHSPDACRLQQRAGPLQQRLQLCLAGGLQRLVTLPPHKICGQAKREWRGKFGGSGGGRSTAGSSRASFSGGWFRGKLAILYAALANVLTALKQAAAHVLLLLLLLLGVLLLGLLRLGLHLLPWLLRLLLLPLLLLPLLGQHQALLLHVKEL